MPILLLVVLHVAGVLLAGLAGVTLFFTGQAVGLVKDSGLTWRLAVLGAVACGVGGCCAGFGSWLALKQRTASPAGLASLCWLAWCAAGAVAGATADARGVYVLPVVALVTCCGTLVVRARGGSPA